MPSRLAAEEPPGPVAQGEKSSEARIARFVEPVQLIAPPPRPGEDSGSVPRLPTAEKRDHLGSAAFQPPRKSFCSSFTVSACLGSVARLVCSRGSAWWSYNSTPFWPSSYSV